MELLAGGVEKQEGFVSSAEEEKPLRWCSMLLQYILIKDYEDKHFFIHNNVH